MNPELMTEEALASINRAIANAKSPMGAYCVGIVSALAWQAGKVPPESVLEAAAQCADLNDSIDWYRFAMLTRESGFGS